ncbi:MAG TPA: ATP-dependent helicase HrpB [Nitrospirota bacterium]|nr:ATP-dependent helicase HrpB [Nitrospirota bacterium]
MTSYPIDAILPELIAAITASPSVVLHAPPGAGKTTRIPLALLKALPPEQGRIVMLEPRRIAAVSAARWMAKSISEDVGATVGYAIRFDTKKSRKTRIEVVTEGILTRRIQSDPGLEDAAVVIFDEFHERSIHADLALALCLDVRKNLRPDLKIMVMSATLDYGPIATLLGNAPVITSLGKAFTVEERYLEDTTGMLPARVANAVRIALKDTQGDILVFLPGSGEIRACVKEIHETVNLDANRITLHPLYGDLPFDEQERAIMPSKEARKVVLATNIAETSLTIEGVQVVIDSGQTRMLRYDPSTGMNRLVTVPVSRASAEQRKGRAGRLGPGVCYRLYGSHDLHGMLPFTQPEMLLSDLSQLVLELAVWGVKDAHVLSWLDAPPPAAWDAALSLLEDLGALDRSGSVTAVGRAMAQLPIHPRLGRLMTRAQELGCPGLGADLAALLTERDIFRHTVADRTVDEPDIRERLDSLRCWRAGKCTDARADRSALRIVERTSKQLSRLTSETAERPNRDIIGQDAVSRLLLAAFPDRICKRRDEGGARFIHVQGRGVRLSLNSHLGSSPYLIAVVVDAGEKAEGFVHIAVPVDEELIRSECATRIETVRKVEWDRKENRITAAIEERYGTLVLSKKPFIPADAEVAPILCETIRMTPGTLTFSREARQFQARVGLMKRSFPEEMWPDLSDQELLQHPEEWLGSWLGGIRGTQGLRALNILPAIRTRLSSKQQQLLEERAPLSMSVPSGSTVPIDYTGGDQPVLAVKLQEMFGLADTPAIAGGRIKLVLHLLSPARRPVQITQDLKGFWDSSYEQVKKDLKGRYPKHPWPDDPWNAMPTRRTKPRGS